MRKRQEKIALGQMTAEESAADPPIMYIVKPEAGCQGKGIFIARKLEELQSRIDQKFKAKMKEYDEYLKAEECLDTQ